MRLVNAGRASSMICDTYLMVKVCVASNNPASGLIIASARTVNVPRMALAVLAGFRSVRGKYLLGPAVVAASGVNSSSGADNKLKPIMIFASGGCSER